VLFASDTPFEPAPGVYIRDTIRVLESMGLEPAEKEKIYRGNAQRVLKLRSV
jgi:aminocarboxymuconate-semialdehyde decarboxylase